MTNSKQRRRWTPLTFTPGVIVLKGPAGITRPVAETFAEVSDPEREKPLIGPAPVFVWPGGQGSAAAVRAVHDKLIAPALARGRTVICVGAWWDQPFAQKLSEVARLEIGLSVWPSVTRLGVVEVRDEAGNDHGGYWHAEGHAGVASHPSDSLRGMVVTSALTRMGMVRWC